MRQSNVTGCMVWVCWVAVMLMVVGGRHSDVECVNPQKTMCNIVKGVTQASTGPLKTP